MPTEYRLNLFLKSRERFVAVSSSAETLIASGGIWRSLDADQETASISGDGISAPSIDWSRHFRDELTTLTPMSGVSSPDLSMPAVMNTPMNSDHPYAPTPEQAALIMSGRGMAAGHPGLAQSSRDWPSGTTK